MASGALLSDHERELQAAARAFARAELSSMWSDTHQLPTAHDRFLATRPAVERMVADGWLVALIPERAGGTGQGLLDFALVAEEFTAVDPSSSLTLFSIVLGLAPLLIAGTAEQRARHLPPFLARGGAPLAALAFSEPGGTANFDSTVPGTGLTTTAVLDGDEWVISGRKRWVSNSAGWDDRGPDLMAVVCRTEDGVPPAEALSVILVPGPVDGLVVTGAMDTLGHRSHLAPDIELDEVRVPADNLVGQRGGGRALTESSFRGSAATVGALSLGVMRAGFEHALAYARDQHRGGGMPIIGHQAVGYALADAKTRMEAVRSLTWRACRAADAGSRDTLELCVEAKIFGSETAVQVLTDLMKVVGISSYGNEHPLARLLQDALAYPLFDGGNMGVRRRQLHRLLARPDYDPLSTTQG